jgi:hypothetical protein
MKAIKRIILVSMGFFIFGCASFPKADNEHQTLLIGSVIQQGKGYQYYSTVSVNGTNRMGIEVTLQELNGEKTYILRTNSNGLFYSVNIPEGSYKITRLYLRKESGSAWASIGWSISSTMRIVEIVRGKVNNLGTLRWNCENDVSNAVTFNTGYSEVRDIFQEKNKSSNWNEKEWANVNVARESVQ